MKKVLETIGINTYIAIKVSYNHSTGSNDFYKMLKRRLTGKYKQDAKYLAQFLRSELHIHTKEHAQY